MLKRQIELLYWSACRIKKAIDLPRSESTWRFLRAELWLHMRRTIQVWWSVIRRKE
ncbi:MAG: hypothetical protein ACYDHZ_00955 [Dehalococcoidia bacterium]